MAHSNLINLVDKTMAENRTKLARQLMITIKNYTFAKPMPEAEVIAVMAFCVGIAVGNQPKNVDKRMLMQLAGKMVAEGEDVASRDMQTGLVDIRGIRLSSQ